MISIIIPVFNGEKCISECLKSLQKQEHGDFEAIIVDNNSTDGTKDIIKSFIVLDSRFKYYICKNQGVSHARNTGIEKALGEYIFFLDNDDTVRSDALKLLYIAAIKHDADIVVSNSLRVHTDYINSNYLLDKSNGVSCLIDGDEIPKFVYEKSVNYTMHNIFKLYRKDIIIKNNIRFDPDFSLGEDLLFNLQIYKKVRNLYYINKPLYIYNVTHDGLTHLYRKDFIEMKIKTTNELKNYLMENDLYDYRFYYLVINDIYALLLNEYKSENGKISNVFHLDFSKALIKSDVFKHLYFKKKVLFILIKYRITPLLWLSLKMGRKFGG